MTVNLTKSDFLCAENINGDIVIHLTKNMLRFAAENHPDFWDGKSGMDTPNLVIEDMDEFTKSMIHALNAEGEDGSTAISRLMDAKIVEVVEDGGFGLDISKL